MNLIFQFCLFGVVSVSLSACARMEAQPPPAQASALAKVSFDPQRDQVLSSEQLKEIQSNYEAMYVSRTGKGDRSEYWTPEILLPKLSAWFQVGRGLRKFEKVSDGYWIYPMAKIPNELIQELSKTLLSDRASLAILSLSFWKEVQHAQEQGFMIGFISSQSPEMVSGVYFHDLGWIGLSVISEPGTLPHELRHSQQYSKIAERRSPSTIAVSCLQSLSSAFGEFDATTYELPLYQKIEEEISNPVLVAYNSKNLVRPELDLFWVSLGYPSLVAQKVVHDSSCPEAVRQKMLNFEKYFIDQQNILQSGLEEVFLLAKTSFRKMQTYHDKGCESAPSEICDRLLKDMRSAQSDLPQAKQAFRLALEKAVQSRPEALRNFLNDLSPEIRKDLCHGALGVGFYLDCREGG